MVYHAYFHSLMSYGLIFWGNFSYSINIFRLQKKAIRIITGISNRDSCRDYLKKLKILPLQSQYLLSILLFVANNIHLFKSNSEVYISNTRHSFDLHLPSPRLTTYQKGTFYMGIRCFHNLPFEIKALVNVKVYKIALKNFLYLHSFYSLQEYFDLKHYKWILHFIVFSLVSNQWNVFISSYLLYLLFFL
jgi:hypothetical protein